MIVSIRYCKSGDRFVDVMRQRGGAMITDREEAIREAIYNFTANDGYYTAVHLVECEGESEEDFYRMEEENGGYNPFWDMEEAR